MKKTYHDGRYGVVRYPQVWAVIDTQHKSSFSNVVSWHQSRDAAHAKATRLNNKETKAVTAGN